VLRDGESFIKKLEERAAEGNDAYVAANIPRLKNLLRALQADRDRLSQLQLRANKLVRDNERKLKG